MSSFANAKATHILNKNINVHVIFNDQSFNDMLTNDIVSFKQLGPAPYIASYINHRVIAMVLSM